MVKKTYGSWPKIFMALPWPKILMALPWPKIFMALLWPKIFKALPLSKILLTPITLNQIGGQTENS